MRDTGMQDHSITDFRWIKTLVVVIALALGSLGLFAIVSDVEADTSCGGG